ncbi:MAG TPA: hypothetical protein VGR07_00485 [Thermoanaerobaculia bacterium]|nr:hypothetical protein [Thermoanaerobaculia bacterium]
MSTIRLRRILPAFTLLAALLVIPAIAHARPSRTHHEGRPAATAPSASFLSSAWHFLTHLGAESGVSIDPDGKPSPSGGPNAGGTGSPTGDSGVSIDPNG